MKHQEFYDVKCWSTVTYCCRSEKRVCSWTGQEIEHQVVITHFTWSKTNIELKIIAVHCLGKISKDSLTELIAS